MPRKLLQKSLLLQVFRLSASMNNMNFKMSLLFFLASSFFITLSAQKIHVSPKTIKFDKVNEGEILDFAYTFNNQGTQPLLFHSYETECTCTQVILPDAPLLPGSSVPVAIRFDTKNKIGYQERKVKVTTSQGAFMLTFKGLVKATQETKNTYKDSKKAP